MISHFNQAPNLKATIVKAPVTSGYEPPSSKPPDVLKRPSVTSDTKPAFGSGLETLASSMTRPTPKPSALPDVPGRTNGGAYGQRDPLPNGVHTIDNGRSHVLDPSPMAGQLRNTPLQGTFRGTPLQGTAPMFNAPNPGAPPAVPKPMAASMPADPMMNLASTMYPTTQHPVQSNPSTLPMNGVPLGNAPALPTNPYGAPVERAAYGQFSGESNFATPDPSKGEDPGAQEINGVPASNYPSNQEIADGVGMAMKKRWKE